MTPGAQIRCKSGSHNQENSDMWIMSLTRRWLAVLVAVCCLAAGCNSLKDTWNSRGVPQQWEPDNAASNGDKNP